MSGLLFTESETCDRVGCHLTATHLSRGFRFCDHHTFTDLLSSAPGYKIESVASAAPTASNPQENPHPPRTQATDSYTTGDPS